MQPHLAITVENILGSKPSDDGKTGLIGFTTVGGELALAIPANLLTTFAAAALTAEAHCGAKTSTSSSVGDIQLIDAFPCESWEFSVSPDGSAVILSFQMSGGGWGHFQIPRQWATHMRETLEMIEEESPSASA